MVLISNLWAFVPYAIQSTLKKKRKKSQNSVTTYPDVTVTPPTPQTVSQEFSVLL